MKIRKVLASLFIFAFSVHCYAQTMEEQLRAKENKEKMQKMMADEKKALAQEQADLVTKSAFILECSNRINSTYYGFYKDRIFEDSEKASGVTGPLKDPSKIKFSGSGLPYTLKNGVVSFSKLMGMFQEEINTKSYKYFQKPPTGDILSGECKVIRDTNKPF